MDQDTIPDDQGDRVWESGYDGHERAQRLRLARLPLAEKLAWLEEAQRIAARLQASREKPSR
ncbi:MAG: hypothetical protein HY925_06595 [Elusimicrobia bacterium]|nr:hypothetical protein [Elusimicrobiota bacterium]